MRFAGTRSEILNLLRISPIFKRALKEVADQAPRSKVSPLDVLPGERCDGHGAVPPRLGTTAIDRLCSHADGGARAGAAA